MRVVEGRCGTRLLVKTVAALRMSGKIRRQDFDRDRATEAGIVGLVHLAHAAGANEGLDLVRPEAGPGRQRHGAGRRCRCLEDCIGRGTAGEQRVDFASQVRVSATGLVEERRALARVL